jgi:hypothetical protein
MGMLFRNGESKCLALLGNIAGILYARASMLFVTGFTWDETRLLDMP